MIARSDIHPGARKWIRAAALGSIWASIEIIAGSFLHNLKVPFSGTMLAVMAVYLLVAFSMHWKETGIILRAGMIAALMKSVSPSAVILGPMVGIMMEAVIMELSIYLLGRNLAGYAVGGMIAVSWALVQKVLNLLVLYGFDLVKIAEGFYLFLVSKTGLEEAEPHYLVILLVSLYALAGLLSAVLSYYHFRSKGKVNPGEGSRVQLEKARQPFNMEQEKQKFAAYNILLVMAAMVGTLYLLNKHIYIPALAAGTALIGYSLIRYKRSMRYLRKPGLWIQLMLVTFLAALIWEWVQTGELLTTTGFLTGLELNFRALVIIFSFSSVSVELRNPLVRGLLYRNGFSALYKALSMSFTILPAIVDRIPRGKKLFFSFRGALPKILRLADELQVLLEINLSRHHNIFIVTGRVQQGKTTFLGECINTFREKHIQVMGFTAPGFFKNDSRSGFILKDISNGNTMPLASREEKEGWFSFRGFHFNPEAFSEGEEIIKKAVDSKADLIIIDEVGPLEMEGKGWKNVISLLDKQFQVPQIWSVRESLAKIIAEKSGIPEENIICIHKSQPRALAGKIIELYLKAND